MPLIIAPNSQIYAKNYAHSLRREGTIVVGVAGKELPSCAIEQAC
jgi:hypothetical protein